MRGSLRLNRCKPHINLRSSQLISTSRHIPFNNHMRNKTPISKTISRTNTHRNNYTLREGVVETLEDEVAEEDLVGGEVQLHPITMDK